MNRRPRNPFLVLLKLELGFQQVRGLELFFALTFFYLPWLGLNVGMFALGYDLTAFYPGILGMLLLFWLLGACGLTTYPQVPLVWSNQANFKAFEFLFTRAVDRRLNFRAKAAAALILVLGPQLPGLVWSLAQPDMVVALDVRSAEAGAQRDTIEGRVFPTERYFQAFPGSTRQAAPKPEEPERLRIRHGWFTYACWIAWTTTLLTALFFAYYALVGHHLRSSGWWANTVLALPLPAVMGAMLFAMWRGINLGDELILCFREHWFAGLLLLAATGYASLRWCEQQFVKLELV